MIPAPTGLLEITRVTRDKPQLGKELGSMSPARRGTNTALCRCEINWPCVHQDVPTGPLGSLTARTIRPTSTSRLSTAFAGDAIHRRLRRVCNKITVMAVENFPRTSFHVDDARTLAHTHSRAHIPVHSYTTAHRDYLVTAPGV